jgi:hypothetical protein
MPFLANITVKAMFIQTCFHVFPHTYTGYPQKNRDLRYKLLFLQGFYLVFDSMWVILWALGVKAGNGFGDKSGFDPDLYN